MGITRRKMTIGWLVGLVLILLWTPVWARLPAEEVQITGSPLRITIGDNGRYAIASPLDNQPDEITQRTLQVWYQGCMFTPHIIDSPTHATWQSIDQSRVSGQGVLADPWYLESSYSATCQQHDQEIIFEVKEQLTYVNGFDHVNLTTQLCGGQHGAVAVAIFVSEVGPQESPRYIPFADDGCASWETVWQQGEPLREPTALRLVGATSQSATKDEIVLGVFTTIILFASTLILWLKMLRPRMFG